MSDITLKEIRSGYNLSKINDNFQTVEEVVNNEVVHSTGGNNIMSQDLDMNSNKILNSPKPTEPNDLVRLQDVVDKDIVANSTFQKFAIADGTVGNLLTLPVEFSQAIVFKDGVSQAGTKGRFTLGPNANQITLETALVGNEEVEVWVNDLFVTDGDSGTTAPTTFVTYEQFGADLTGVIPADDAIVACHEYANEYGLAVVQSHGTVYWQNKTAVVKTPTDLRGLTVRVDANSGTPDLTYSQPGMYSIESDKDTYVLTEDEINELNTTYQEYFNKYSQRLPEELFGKYSGRYVEIYSDLLEVNRNSNTAQPQYAREQTSISRKGQLESPIYHDLKGRITEVRVYPREDFHLYFTAPKLLIEEAPSFRLILCRRSLTKIRDLIIQEESETWPSNVREIIEIYNCADVTLDGFDALSQPIGSTNFGAVYMTVASDVLRLKVYRVRSNGGLSAFASNYVRDSIFRDCNMNRIDCHWGGYDMLISGCTTTNMGVSIGGGGLLRVTDHTHKQTGPVSSPYGEIFVQSIVEVRPDYGAKFDGTIVVDGARMVFDESFDLDLPGRDLTYSVVKVKPDSLNESWGGVMQRTKRIEVRNVTLEFPESMAKLDSSFQLKVVNFDEQISGEALFPHEIIVDNISTVNPPSDFVITAYEPPNYMHPNNHAMYAAPSPENGDYNQKVLVRDTRCSTRVVNRRAEFGLVKFVQDWSQTTTTYPDYLDDELAIRPKIVVENCENASLGLAVKGRCYVKGGSVSQLQSTMSGISPFKPTEDEIFIRLDEVDIELVSSLDNGNSYEQNERVYAFNCNFGDATEIDGGTHPSLIADSYQGTGNRVSASTTNWTSTTPYFFDGDTEIRQINGAGTPINSVTPAFIGQEYQSTISGTWFKAMGTTSADWEPIGGFVRLIANNPPVAGLVVDFVGQRYIDTSTDPHEEYYAASLTVGDWVRLA